MRLFYWLVLTAFFITACQDPCDESECKGRSALFSFRILDQSGNDIVFDFSLVNQDSVKVLGSNSGAISTLEKDLTIKEIQTATDTFNIFQFSVDNVHLRYLIRTATADTVIIDTVRTDYILENSDCCGIELIEYEASLNSAALCENCQPDQYHTLVR